MILSGRKLNDKAIKAISPIPRQESFGPASVDIYADIDQPQIIESGEHLVVAAQEDIQVPTDIAIMISGRSSHMRQGLFMPAGWLDPGFESDKENGYPLKLEFGNTSDGAAVLNPNEAAARLTFFELSAETSGYNGTYGVNNE